MRLRKLMLPLVAVLMLLVSTGDLRADISNAAVLYLRIAPGARAAGMGEAYVAIADDATSTHWNPAGLGAYPLSDSWIESKVPERLRPISALAALKMGGSSDYMAYEVWAVSPAGLVRFDNKDWHLDETFNTRTDQTVREIISSYFNVTDEQSLDEMVAKVAVVNNRRSSEYLADLHQRVMALVPEDYRGRESLRMMWDTLLAGYDECRVNWERIDEVEKYFGEGLKDSTLNEVEIDRISIAVEKARTRFIPEELKVPYAVNYRGELTSITSTEEYILAGSRGGLVVYDGKRWRPITVEDGLPSNNVLCLYGEGNEAYIGTDSGLARFLGHRLAPVRGGEQLPEGPVTAVGANGNDNIWIVLNNDLYHFDGRNWSNYMKYKVVLDDSPEAIARKFALYGTDTEVRRFAEKFTELNLGGPLEEEEPDTASEVSAPPEDLPQDIMAAVVDGLDAPEPDDSVSVDQPASEPDSVSGPSPDAIPEIEPPAEDEPPVADGELKPGMLVRVPFVVELKGKVNSIYAGPDHRVWIGTDYGLLYFDGKEWSMPGYRTYRLKEGDTFEDLVAAKRHKDTTAAEAYAALLGDINDFDEEPMAVGRKVRIYRNPAGASINRIVRNGEKLYFATDAGLIEYDGYFWARSDVRGLDRTNAVDALSIGDELWLASDEKVVTKANALMQLTLMHVKWLPELTDDVYYEFVSFVSSSRDWGTFGGNITFISYGEFMRTGEMGDTLDYFDSFDIAFTGSYGTALSPSLKAGLSVRLMYSKLSDLGAGMEKGRGTSTGFAVDFGLLYQMTRRMNWGLAITNVGPKMAYIDASQADDLPRNLALGFAYKLLQSEYYHFLVTAEANKTLVGLDDGLSEELKQLVLNGGAEFLYANIFALRAGYIHDEEGEVKTMTLGLGLALFDTFKFDFSYIPSNSTESLRNTLRISISVLP